MVEVLFFEKPGCVNNRRQKALLAAAGHRVVARDLLQEPWTPEALARFVRPLPKAQWFNPSAPRIKSGELDPAKLTEEAALAAMVADPLLIRRPLMQVADQCRVGFDPVAVHAWIGLAEYGSETAETLEQCPRPQTPCKTTGEIDE